MVYRPQPWIDYGVPDPIPVSQRATSDGYGYHITVSGLMIKDPTLLNMSEGATHMGFDWAANPDAIKAPVMTNISSTYGIVAPRGTIIGVTGNLGLAKHFVRQALAGTNGCKVLISDDVDVDKMTPESRQSEIDLILKSTISPETIEDFLRTYKVQNLAIDVQIHTDLGWARSMVEKFKMRSVFLVFGYKNTLIHSLDVVYECLTSRTQDSTFPGLAPSLPVHRWTVIKNRYGKIGVSGDVFVLGSDV